MKIAIGQIKGFLGDFEQSDKKVSHLIEQTRGKADLLVFPEGGIFGYPPTDFIKQSRFLEKQNLILNTLQQKLPSSLKLLIGVFSPTKKGLKNGACLLEKTSLTSYFFQKISLR